MAERSSKFNIKFLFPVMAGRLCFYELLTTISERTDIGHTDTAHFTFTEPQQECSRIKTAEHIMRGILAQKTSHASTNTKNTVIDLLSYIHV